MLSGTTLYAPDVQNCAIINNGLLIVYMYFQKYKGDFIRTTKTFLMKTKTQMMGKIEWLVSSMRNKGHEVKMFHTDQGTEYRLYWIKSYMRVNIISHGVTGRFAQAQMNETERINRNVTEMACMMLIDACLLTKWSGYAVCTRKLFKIDAPIKILEKEIYYKCFFKRDTNLKRFKIWRCKV